MSTYTVATLKSELAGTIHGTTLNQVTNVNGLIYRAARTLLLDCDPQETKRTLEFITPIYNSVYDYPLAPDVKGNKIIDIFPQVQRYPVDIWSQAYNQAFDVWKQNVFGGQKNMFTMNFNTGVKTLRVNAPFLNAPVVINQAESTNDNGIWTTSGTASNIQNNNTNFVQGAGSLQFDVTIGSASIVNSTMAQVNLSNVVNQSSLFVWVYIQTGSNLTSVNLQWGSDASDYYTRTVTLNQQGVVFQNGWNLCQFIWNGSTIIGTPNPSAINFVQVTLNVTANMPACLMNGIDSILGTILSYRYYSKYMFQNATTLAFQETITDDSNLINLDTESYNLMFNLVAFLIMQQVQGLDAMFYDANFFGQQYQTGLAEYKAAYKSETQKPQTTYYAEPNKSYGQYLGRRYS